MAYMYIYIICFCDYAINAGQVRSSSRIQKIEKLHKRDTKGTPS